MKVRMAALAAAVGCGGERPDVDKGSPVENLVTVSFESAAAGEAFVRWEADGVVERRSLGEGPPGPWRTTIWVPSGTATTITAGVRTDRGRDVELNPVRVRLPKAPSKIRWELEVDRPGSQLGDGVMLINAYDDEDSYGMVIDRHARVLWWVEPDRKDQRLLRMRPGRDDASIVWGRFANDHRYLPDDGYITRLDLDADQRRTDTRAVAHHHDWVELPDGRFAWLSWVYDDAILFQGAGVVPLAADAIRAAPEGSDAGDESILFDFFRDYPHDPVFTCGHQTPGQFAGEDWWEWGHANSIAFDEEAQAFRILPRYLDAVLEIGLDGALHWQAGGAHSDFGVEGWFRHAHASALTGDVIAAFDNGDHKPAPIVSRAVGLEIDPEADTVREVWSIPDPRGKYTDFLGDVTVLPGGNVLILFSPDGLLQEFTPDGEVVWQARLRGMTTARLTWTDTLAPR